MDTTPQLTPDVEQKLRRYLEIQKEERALREEKKALQDALGSFLEQAETAQWFPSVDGQPLRVNRSTVTEITYDEDILRNRLGDRYPAILAPDPKKLKEHIAQATQLLQPILTQIGSPDRNRVMSAVQQGIVEKSEFAGAFTKAEKVRVSVGKPRGNY